MRRGLSTGLTIGILLVAGLFWGMLLLQAEEAVFSRAPLLDELYYLDRAADLTSDSSPYFMSPLYPILVAATGSGSGLSEIGVLPRGSLVGIRLLQIACWFGVVLLLRRIAGRTYAATIAPGLRRELLTWFPALLFALYRPAAVFSLSVLLELPLLLLLTLSMDLLTLGEDRRWRGPILGVVLGLAVLLRGTALLLVPVAIWAMWNESADRGPRWRGLIGLILSLLVVVAPAVVHNSILAGRPAGPTLNGGLNFFIGNGPQANGLYMNLLPGDWREDPAGTAHLSKETGHAVNIPEADVLWGKAAAKAVGEDPTRFARLYLKKIWLHFQGWEIDQLVPLDGWAREAPLLRGLFVPWRLIVVLGLAGLGLLFGRGDSRRPVRIWFWVLLALLLGQSLFFVISRYRLMLAPALCLLAGAGVAVGLDGAGRSGRPRLFMGVAAVMALVLSQPWGLGEVRELWAAQAKVNQAHRWALLAESLPAAEISFPGKESANARAEQLYDEALAGPSTRPEWWLALALVQVGQGDEAAAEATLVEGNDHHPGHLEIQRMLLGLLLGQNRSDEALTWAETLLLDNPGDADTLHNYTILLARGGRIAEAMEAATELMNSHPRDARGYGDLGILLARSGRNEEARSIFERGLEALPDDPGLEKNLKVLERTMD